MAVEKVICTFCDTRGPRSREDVIPQWISDELGGPAEFKLDRSHAQPGQVTHDPTKTYGSAAGLKYPDVCVPCNTVWMSQLETAAQPILTPMIRGQEVTLNDHDLEIVAFWAVKTALMLDAYHRPRLIPPEKGTHLLWRDRKPPRDCRVFLGAYEAPLDGVWLPFGRSGLDYTIGRKDRSIVKLKSVRIPIAFSHLLVVTDIVIGDTANKAFKGFAPANRRSFLEAWPIVEILMWPPERAIDFPTFLHLATGVLKPPTRAF